MSRLSKAMQKMRKAEPKKCKLDHHTSDSPEVTKLKQRLVDTVEKVKKEGLN